MKRCILVATLVVLGFVAFGQDASYQVYINDKLVEDAEAKLTSMRGYSRTYQWSFKRVFNNDKPYFMGDIEYYYTLYVTIGLGAKLTISNTEYGNLTRDTYEVLLNAFDFAYDTKNECIFSSSDFREINPMSNEVTFKLELKEKKE